MKLNLKPVGAYKEKAGPRRPPPPAAAQAAKDVVGDRIAYGAASVAERLRNSCGRSQGQPLAARDSWRFPFYLGIDARAGGCELRRGSQGDSRGVHTSPSTGEKMIPVSPKADALALAGFLTGERFAEMARDRDFARMAAWLGQLPKIDNAEPTREG